MNSIGLSLARHHKQGYIGTLACQALGTAVAVASMIVFLGASARDGIPTDLPNKNQQAVNFMDVQTIQTVMGLILIIVAFSVVFVVASTVGFMVTGRRRELALLRLAGASSMQVTGIIMREVATVSVGGLVLGGALGVAVTGPYSKALVRMGAAPDGFGPQYRIQALVFGLVLVAVASAIGGLVPARKIGKVPPIEALSPVEERSNRLGITRLLAGLAGLAGFVTCMVIPADVGSLDAVAVLAMVSAIVFLTSFSPLIVPGLALAISFVLRWVQPGALLLAGRHAYWNSRRTASTAAPIVLFLALGGGLFMVAQSAQAGSIIAEAKGVPAQSVITEVSRQQADALASAITSQRGSAAIRISESDKWGWDMADPHDYPRLMWADVDRLAEVMGVTWDKGSVKDIADNVVAATSDSVRIGDKFALQAPDGTKVNVVVGAVLGGQTRFLGVNFIGDFGSFVLDKAPKSMKIYVRGQEPDPSFRQAIQSVTSKARVMSLSQEVAQWVKSARTTQTRGLTGFLVGVLLLTFVALIVTTIGSVRERAGEFGLVRSLGGRRGDGLTVVVTEVIVVLISGFILSGAALGAVYLKVAQYLDVQGLTVEPSIPGTELAVLSVIAGVGAFTAAALAFLSSTRQRSRQSGF